MPVADKKATTVERGARVYDSQCGYCHDADPAQLRAHPEQLPELLRSERIRAHRFPLEEDDLRALVDYLKEKR